MSEDGYTLAEALAALFMIGLAVAGLTQAATVIGRIQSDASRSVGRERMLGRADRDFQRLLERQGPFASDTGAFKGGASAFDFPCGASQCGARLSDEKTGTRLELSDAAGVTRSVLIADPSGAHFVYADEDGDAAVWPRAGAQTLGRRTLRSISIVEPAPSGERPLVEARLWGEQPLDCHFDLISQACREATP